MATLKKIWDKSKKIVRDESKITILRENKGKLAAVAVIAVVPLGIVIAGFGWAWQYWNKRQEAAAAKKQESV